MLRLPQRVLPSQLCSDSVVVLGDGPSSDEYDIDEIFRRRPTIFGYGRAWQRGPLTYYVAWTPQLVRQVLDECKTPMCILVPEKFVENWTRLKLIKDCIHSFAEVSNAGSHHLPVAVRYAIAYKKKDLFIVGEDGWCLLDGRLRSFGKIYSDKVTYSDRDQKRILATGQAEKEQLWKDGTQNRFSIHWNEAMVAENHGFNIHNLSVRGWPRVAYGVHPEVMMQPFAEIDRTGPAIVFTCEGPSPRNFGWRRKLRETIIPLARLRALQPSLAIFVRSDEFTEHLREDLTPMDIVVGKKDDPVDESKFDNVYYMQLPIIKGV